MEESKSGATSAAQSIGSGLSVPTDVIFRIERQAHTTPSSMKNHHYHNGYEMYYLYSGDRYYFIKDRIYHVKRGNLVLIKPYDIHCTSNYGKSGYDRCLIMFKRSFIDGITTEGVNLFECCDKDIHIIQLSFQEQAYVETLLSQMSTEYKASGVGVDLFLKTAMVQLLLIASRHASASFASGESDISPTNKTVSEAAAYINNNYSEDITLESISAKYFISECYFSRTFKRVTGISFNEYLNGVRIKEAQHLLAATDMSISDVGTEVGYKSATHFGRSFKSIVGMSPSAYRRIKKRRAQK